MLKRSSKCIIFNNFFLCLLFYIFLQKIPTVLTYNVSEDYDIELEPVEKVDVSPYIYPIISFLNLSVFNVAPEKTELDLNLKPIPPIDTQTLTEKFEELMNRTAESSKKFKEKDLNLSQEIEKSLNQFQPRSDILISDEESNGNFLMKFLFNFYIPPILTFYKPLLNEEVKYYKNLINVSKQFLNNTRILPSILNNVIKHNNNDTYEDFEMTIKLNDTELKDSNFSLRTAAISNSTEYNAENDSVLEIIPRWNDIFEFSMKDEPKTKTPSKLSQVEATTNRNSDKLLKAEIFFKPVEKDYQSKFKNYSAPSTSTELPKLSFTNNTSILALFKPGKIPRINIKKDPNSELSFKIKIPLIMNNTDEKNNTYDDHNGAYIFDTTLEIPASDNPGSVAQETYNPLINISDLRISTTTSSTPTISNEFDAVQPRILYSPEGSMIPGALKLSSTSTTTTTTKPPSISLKTASRDPYKSRMQPAFSSRYSANSTASKSVIETLTTENDTKHISTTNKPLINSTSVPDSQQVENATKSNVFLDKLSVNSTAASVSEETTLASSSEINNDTETSKDVKNLRKRELPISDQYDFNDRQELASYFYNGKKIHESYLNYANSIDPELPQDFTQHQDKFSGRTDLSSLGNEVIYQKNQENSQNFGPGYNLQQKPPSSFDYSFPNTNLKNHVEKEVSLPEKETSTVVSVKSHNVIMNRKSKESQKNILNRKKVNSKRKNNRDSKLKKKNNRSTKRKVYRNSKTGKKKIAKTYAGYKNTKARSSTRRRGQNNKIIKKKMSNRVRSKKRNTKKRNDNTRFRDSY